MSQRFVIVHQHYDAKDADANLTSALADKIRSGKYLTVRINTHTSVDNVWYACILDRRTRIDKIVAKYNSDIATTFRDALGHNMASSVQLVCLQYVGTIQLSYTTDCKWVTYEDKLSTQPVDTLCISWLVSMLPYVPAKCDQIDIVHSPKPDGKTNYHCDTSTDDVIGMARPYVNRRVCYIKKFYMNTNSRSNDMLSLQIKRWTDSYPDYQIVRINSDIKPIITCKSIIVDQRKNKDGLGFNLQTASSNIIRIVVISGSFVPSIGYVDQIIYDNGNILSDPDSSYFNPTHQ